MKGKPKKSNKSKFSDIKDDNSLALYLKKVLSRATSLGHLYHYTTFDTIKKIYLSNTLRLHKASGMNDIAEDKSIDRNGLSNHLFYSCFSLVDENAEMWNMYSNRDDGCILGINFETARKMVDCSLQLPEQDKSQTTEKMKIDDKPFFSSIVYYFKKEDRKNNSLECMTVYNPGYSESYEGFELVGLVKSSFWRFEKEARLIVQTEREYSDKYLELKLPDDFWSGCKII